MRQNVAKLMTAIVMFLSVMIFSTAHSKAANHYTITARVAAGKGTVSVSESEVPAGGSATIAISPSGGYSLTAIIDNGVSVGSLSASYVLSNIQADHDVQVSFSAPSFTISSSVTNAYGTISPSGSVLVPYGESKSFTIQANDTFRINQLAVDGLVQKSMHGDSSYVYTFNNVTTNHTIVADFAAFEAPAATPSVAPKTETANAASESTFDRTIRRGGEFSLVFAIVAILMAGLTLVLTPVSNAIGLYSWQEWLLSWFKGKNKGDGLVRERGSGFGLPLARISLFEVKPDGNQSHVNSILADKKGRYKFFAKAGTYTLKVSKYGYVPLKIGNQIAEEFTVRIEGKHEAIAPDILMAPAEAGFKRKLAYLKLASKLEVVLVWAAVLLSIVGCIFAIFRFGSDPYALANQLILLLYLVSICLIYLQLTKVSIQGKVTSGQHSSAGGAIARIFTREGKLTRMVAVGSDGKFKAKVKAGHYQVYAVKPGFILTSPNWINVHRTLPAEELKVVLEAR